MSHWRRFTVVISSASGRANWVMARHFTRRTTAGRWHYNGLALKGAGLTPYSRMGDGRAVLRRRYEKVSPVRRCIIWAFRRPRVKYRHQRIASVSGNGGARPMLMRVAPSHLRFGHFEHFYIAASRKRFVSWLTLPFVITGTSCR